MFIHPWMIQEESKEQKYKRAFLLSQRKAKHLSERIKMFINGLEKFKEKEKREILKEFEFLNEFTSAKRN